MFSNSNVKIGDIFVCSWGYDQTNVNFYQVVGLSGKTMVILHEVCKKIVKENSCMSGECKPAPNIFLNDNILRKKVKINNNGELSIQINSYSTARLVQPEKIYCFSTYY